jgi:hypothetical protein
MVSKSGDRRSSRGDDEAQKSRNQAFFRRFLRLVQVKNPIP